MSDIRFNNWKHQSGTGGVSQNSGGNVGIGSTLPSSKLDVGGDGKFTGVVTATAFYGDGSNLTSVAGQGVGIGSTLGVVGYGLPEHSTCGSYSTHPPFPSCICWGWTDAGRRRWGCVWSCFPRISILRKLVE